MPFLASLILFATSGRVELVNQIFQVPAADWRYVDIRPMRGPAIVEAEFNVESGPPVRLMLIAHGNLARMSHGELHALASTSASHGGSFQQLVPWGDYVVVLENAAPENRASPQPASVHLRTTLDYDFATQLSPNRRLTVIAISFAVFFGLVGFSARLLLAAHPRDRTSGHGVSTRDDLPL